MMASVLPPRMRCAKCGQRLKNGDAIRITETGVVGVTGGQGMYRNTLILRERVTVVEHTLPCTRTEKD